MFGMGTGGSLRLLSPERSRAPAFCCRAFSSRRSAVDHRLPTSGAQTCRRLPCSADSAIERPPGFPGSASLASLPPFVLPFRSRFPAPLSGFRFRFAASASHPQNRTGWSPASARPRLPLPPLTFFLTNLLGFGLSHSSLGSTSASLRPLPFPPGPCSLIPTSFSFKIKPSTD